MSTFDYLLNWKLQVGSHAFPGPDGGTCINEAAVVAAGFAYRSIAVVESMPECFSRPICRFAMRINDDATDEERQRLLPYVTRLACADTPEVEMRRAAYINYHSERCYRFTGTPWHCAVAFIPTQVLVMDEALKVLEGALAIGRQADLYSAEEVQSRMDTARAQPKQSAPPRRVSASAAIKGWFKHKNADPVA